ncbi:GH3 auxin-responsive promoter family protein [Chondrinema litorale]|uniref:GH3 auxin-responsive promoter family protein n=1 Tax=Chondrinema litorale TaxID=2994555 RepID=UPI00254293AB|nr:GH3 auxin-responsive promoter family protein [Chondrinema litorale]UZR94833.1 GH3 auxin-responsive promoter family protein [Chondrinema litorale]
MEILNSFFNWIMSKRITQIQEFMDNPHEVQGNIFDYLIGMARHTEWGKKYGYSDISNFDQFRERVPVSSYEQFFPYIERMMHGEQRLLWPTKVKWFAKSSGTTNARSKFIPVTDESLEECHFKGGKDLVSLYVNKNPETKLFGGKTIAIGGTYQKNELNAKMYYGDVSAIIMKNLPIWAEYMRAPGIDVALMDNWEEKIEKMARLTTDEDITNISGVPTWTIVLLERILEITGKDNIAEVWPNIELFSHGAVAFDPYRETFKKLIPKSDMNYLEIYNASEGFFGMQDTNKPNEMLLMLDYGVFYEFIPSSEFDKEYPKTIGLADVKIGENYAIVISTNGGLWRYKIGDTIRFTSTTPYRFKISGRTKHFINAFGEEVIVENAEEALTQACKVSGAEVVNFTVAPVYLETGKKGGHQWLIEFEKLPENKELFRNTLDETLRKINSDYDAKRAHNLALVMLEIIELPKNTFYDWMKRRGKLGGQHKVPRLSNNREYVEDILLMLSESRTPTP